MKLAVRAARYLAISGMVSGMVAAGSIGACNSDSGTSGGTDAGGSADTGTTAELDTGIAADTGTTINPTPDAGTGTPTPDAGTTVDSGTHEGTDASDAAVADAADGATPNFCAQAAQAGLDFCEDFDEGDPLSLDASTGPYWTQAVGTAAEVALSTAQVSSPPNSLLVALANGSVNADQSAKVVKMITPANGVQQAIYEFDMYIAQVPLFATGGFATDFQFDDTSGGTDQFGFRIGVFSNATGWDHADLEHNHPVLGGADDITSPIAITYQAWNHIKMVVAYSALADDGGDSVSFQLYLNNSTTAAVNAQYPAPFTKAAFARFAAGMVYAFDGTNKDWNIYYDNFTLKLQ